MKILLNPKVFFILLVAFLVSSAAWFFFGTYYQKKLYTFKYGPILQELLPTPDLIGKCTRYGKAPKDEYLESYVVKQGDTLLSIARNQLSDSSKVYQLINLNNDNYPELSIKNSYIEPGWELYIRLKDRKITEAITSFARQSIQWSIEIINQEKYEVLKREIEQDKTVINRGAVFNKKVNDYFTQK